MSTSGTTNIKQITELNTEKNLGLNILPAKDHAEAFLMVETGRAAAFVMDDILLLQPRRGFEGTERTTRSPPMRLSVEPYGIMLRKDDPAFKKVVDDAMIAIYKGGEINKIYDKWFLNAIPPKGRESRRADERRVQAGHRQADRQRRSQRTTNSLRISARLSGAASKAAPLLR